jgi:hypothetical protein
MDDVTETCAASAIDDRSAERIAEYVSQKLAELMQPYRTGGALDPNEELRPVFMKVSAYCRWSGKGETKVWEEIKAGRLEVVRDGRNVLITYRSALKRALEVAAETVEPQDHRAALRRALAKVEANFQPAE